MRTLERKAHAGCSWIVDQLIGIRELEQRLTVALACGDQHCSVWLRSRLAELDRWVDTLDRALDTSAPASDNDRVVWRSNRPICRSGGHSLDSEGSPRLARRGSPLQRAG
jgi:hypothetical protein